MQVSQALWIWLYCICSFGFANTFLLTIPKAAMEQNGSIRQGGTFFDRSHLTARIASKVLVDFSRQAHSKFEPPAGQISERQYATEKRR